MTLFTVFSKRVANELCTQGFKVIKTGINNQWPQYNVYYFENTPKFQEALKKLTSR